MKKYIYLLLMLLAIAPLTSVAQHRALYSQYMFNRLVINPGAAGTTEGVPVHISLRRQWSGIAEAPQTQLLAADSYIGYNTAIGGYIFNEVTGPTRKIGLSFGGAYQMYFDSRTGRRTERNNYGARLERKRVLSFGLFGMIYQQSLAYDELRTEIPGDIALAQGSFNQVLPDVNFGVFYRDRDVWYVGFAAMHLVQSQPYATPSGPVRTYYLQAGYRFGDKEYLSIEPSFLLQSIESFWTFRNNGNVRVLPFQADINVRALWKNLFWAGVSYRHGDAAVGMIGIEQKTFRLGYSYDFTLSDIRNYSGGSHELAITMILFQD